MYAFVGRTEELVAYVALLVEFVELLYNDKIAHN